MRVVCIAISEHNMAMPLRRSIDSDSFFCFVGCGDCYVWWLSPRPTTLSQITGKLQWSVHISAYHSMSRSMRMMVDMLIALTTSGWRDRRREHTSSFDDGHHHVADGVEPYSKGNTVFCSDRCVSNDAPLISDEGSCAYRCTSEQVSVGIWGMWLTAEWASLRNWARGAPAISF